MSDHTHCWYCTNTNRYGEETLRMYDVKPRCPHCDRSGKLERSSSGLITCLQCGYQETSPVIARAERDNSQCTYCGLSTPAPVEYHHDDFMCRRIQAAINDGYGPASVAFGVLAAADTVLREADSEVVDTDALRSSAFGDSE